jgi:tetratricopeptide (TPR) repeat protein
VADPSSYLRDLGYSDPLSPSLTQLDASRSLHLAAAYLGSGQTARAIEPLEAAAALADDLARVLLAHAYLEVGRFSDCQRTLETIASESHRTFALMIEGRLRLAEGRRHDALTLLAGARELAQSPALEALLGDVYRGLSRLVEAEQCYRSALARDPYLPGAEIGLAALCLHQNRNEEAADAALRATGLDFGIAMAHYLLALASIRLRRHMTAVTALQTCLKLAPEHPAARSLLRRLQC